MGYVCGVTQHYTHSNEIERLYPNKYVQVRSCVLMLPNHLMCFNCSVVLHYHFVLNGLLIVMILEFLITSMVVML